MSHDEEFTDWAGRNSPALLHRATMLCGERQRAEDLLQETLVKMFLNWRRIDHDDNPMGFAYTTLFRLFVSSRRKRSATETPRDALPERPVVDHTSDLRLDLITALQSLPPRERCVVVARYLDGYPVADVATLMRRSEGWVRVTAHRALRKLRDSPAMSMSHQ